ncbi:MAG TPA: HNH endonuclease signature motif containing protein [Methylocella sp.]
MPTIEEALNALAWRKSQQPKSKDPDRDRRKAFYASRAWRQARYTALKAAKGRCQACGIAANDARLVVDHVKPLRHHWHLRLEQSNLQVLCDDCNLAKGSWDETDFRPSE